MPTTRPHRTPARCLLAAAALTALTSGCSAPPPATAEQWTPPAWMTEQAQAREQFVTTLQACMDARGWSLTVNASGGFEEPFTDQEEGRRAVADSDACLREQGVDPDAFGSAPTESELRATYPYDVDTYECLVAQGVEMAQRPPTEDVYVEQGLGGDSRELAESWSPYLDSAVQALPAERIAELEQVCPARWTFAAMS